MEDSKKTKTFANGPEYGQDSSKQFYVEVELGLGFSLRVTRTERKADTWDGKGLRIQICDQNGHLYPGPEVHRSLANRVISAISLASDDRIQWEDPRICEDDGEVFGLAPIGTAVPFDDAELLGRVEDSHEEDGSELDSSLVTQGHVTGTNDIVITEGSEDA